MILLSLAEAQATTTATGQYALGDPIVIKDATYGVIGAVWCYFNEAMGVLGSPIYGYSSASYPYYVSDDENDSYVLGQEYCVGSPLMSAVTTAVAYGFVQVYGRNTQVLTTDGNVTAGQTLIGSSTDGTWNGIAFSQDIAASSGTVYPGRGYTVGMSLVADDSNSLIAVNSAIFNSIWAPIIAGHIGG